MILFTNECGNDEWVKSCKHRISRVGSTLCDWQGMIVSSGSHVAAPVIAAPLYSTLSVVQRMC